MSFWSAIANFFKGFFRSIPALVTGILVGWACGPCNIVVAGILGGVTAAVVNTAINGGNWGQAIGMGAVLGGIIGGIGGDVFKGFGGVPADKFSWGNFVAMVKTGAAFGAVIGGISTAIHGGNVFQNVAMGALSGGVSAAAAFGIMKGATEAWAAWNTADGVGAAAAGCKGGCLKGGYRPAGFQLADQFPMEEGFRLTQDYDDKSHNGWDVRMSQTGKRFPDPVNATNDGTIIKIGPDSGPNPKANIIALQINKDQVAIYAHVTPLSGLKVGDPVNAGQILGWTDLSGNTNNFHLHFSVTSGGHRVDPNVYFGNLSR